MTTISVVTALYSHRYAQYLDRWWNAIESLHRYPDEIVLATPAGEDYGLFGSIPDWYHGSIIKVEGTGGGVHGPWYDGERATTSDWIFGLGIDDQFHPTAFDEVEQAQAQNAQIIIDRIDYLQGGSWEANWNPEAWRSRNFAPGGVCGHHKSLKPFWEVIPSDLRWNDYAFYLLALKRNVRLYRASTTRMIHDLGTNHETVSGMRRDSSQDALADQQIQDFIRSLEL